MTVSLASSSYQAQEQDRAEAELSMGEEIEEEAGRASVLTGVEVVEAVEEAR